MGKKVAQPLMTRCDQSSVFCACTLMLRFNHHSAEINEGTGGELQLPFITVRRHTRETPPVALVIPEAATIICGAVVVPPAVVVPVVSAETHPVGVVLGS